MARYWPSSFFCVFMDRDGVEVHKLAQKEQGQYPVILINKGFIVWLSVKFFSQNMAGSPILLAHLGSQSKHKI